MINDIFSTPPLLINELGNKFWLNETLTNWARGVDKNGVSLPWTAFFVESPTGFRTIVLVDENQQVLCENTAMDAIASYIDIHKIERSFI